MDMQELVKKHIKFTSQGDFIRSVKHLRLDITLAIVKQKLLLIAMKWGILSL